MSHQQINFNSVFMRLLSPNNQERKMAENYIFYNFCNNPNFPFMLIDFFSHSTNIIYKQYALIIIGKYIRYRNQKLKRNNEPFDNEFFANIIASINPFIFNETNPQLIKQLSAIVFNFSCYKYPSVFSELENYISLYQNDPKFITFSFYLFQSLYFNQHLSKLYEELIKKYLENILLFGLISKDTEIILYSIEILTNNISIFENHDNFLQHEEALTQIAADSLNYPSDFFNLFWLKISNPIFHSNFPSFFEIAFKMLPICQQQINYLKPLLNFIISHPNLIPENEIINITNLFFGLSMDETIPNIHFFFYGILANYPQYYDYFKENLCNAISNNNPKIVEVGKKFLKKFLDLEQAQNEANDYLSFIFENFNTANDIIFSCSCIKVLYAKLDFNNYCKAFKFLHDLLQSPGLGDTYTHKIIGACIKLSQENSSYLFFEDFLSLLPSIINVKNSELLAEYISLLTYLLNYKNNVRTANYIDLMGIMKTQINLLKQNANLGTTFPLFYFSLFSFLLFYYSPNIFKSLLDNAVEAIEIAFDNLKQLNEMYLNQHLEDENCYEKIMYKLIESISKFSQKTRGFFSPIFRPLYFFCTSFSTFLLDILTTDLVNEKNNYPTIPLSYKVDPYPSINNIYMYILNMVDVIKNINHIKDAFRFLNSAKFISLSCDYEIINCYFSHFPKLFEIAHNCPELAKALTNAIMIFTKSNSILNRYDWYPQLKANLIEQEIQFIEGSPYLNDSSNVSFQEYIPDMIILFCKANHDYGHIMFNKMKKMFDTDGVDIFDLKVSHLFFLLLKHNFCSEDELNFILKWISLFDPKTVSSKITGNLFFYSCIIFTLALEKINIFDEAIEYQISNFSQLLQTIQNELDHSSFYYLILTFVSNNIKFLPKYYKFLDKAISLFPMFIDVEFCSKYMMKLMKLVNVYIQNCQDINLVESCISAFLRYFGYLNFSNKIFSIPDDLHHNALRFTKDLIAYYFKVKSNAMTLDNIIEQCLPEQKDSKDYILSLLS